MGDKEKSLLDSFTETIRHTFDIATQAASKALEPEPSKPQKQLVVSPNPTDAFESLPDPTNVAKKKPRKKSGVDTSGRITTNYDSLDSVTPMPAPKKAAKVSKTSAKKSVRKAAKTVVQKSKKKSKKSLPRKTAKQRRSLGKKRKTAKRK